MKFTAHAIKRVNMRRINKEMIDMALKYGIRVYNAGAKFVFVRKKDIPDDLPARIAEKIEGLVLVLNPVDNTVITVYKNRKELKRIKRKVKRYDKESGGKFPRRIFKISELF
ncbi:protein of unknown function (DUF4258) [Candidatus Kryptonium thompsonii]|uniref:DUF4258 domain-containing protein n=3 Tax=Candidatus Kryptonium thompsonii TaxID=1633631 RepID=A0A0P1LMP5_9BACT|nr:DUF4258 domain-containing protein [Candidatus Kryptonium thompsoni]CUS82668.1 protein of unknown function (DUF4258) [Candidatus Kryptonium thompsoni]CUS83317.1 protein of unknown function (DUF4258) [Candidatus Kryptonium thompsoni]CUS87608.1 protein of unknown function (DUF4258) [Candidatus Kryptonium thompsoni]CUS92801.1 protein of unknown function (DUF4258) [Candidatus Kryptonium thompsoni]CUS94701.1 protein of unknown function (DUF4258) [Candidatus Kryptonium thompsoni]